MLIWFHVLRDQMIKASQTPIPPAFGCKHRGPVFSFSAFQSKSLFGANLLYLLQNQTWTNDNLSRVSLIWNCPTFVTVERLVPSSAHATSFLMLFRNPPGFCNPRTALTYNPICFQQRLLFVDVSFISWGALCLPVHSIISDKTTEGIQIETRSVELMQYHEANDGCKAKKFTKQGKSLF